MSGIKYKIDHRLTHHYGLRPLGEELDFIINYDVKYRLGASAVEDGDKQEKDSR